MLGLKETLAMPRPVATSGPRRSSHLLAGGAPCADTTDQVVTSDDSKEDVVMDGAAEDACQCAPPSDNAPALPVKGSPAPHAVPPVDRVVPAPPAEGARTPLPDNDTFFNAPPDNDAHALPANDVHAPPANDADMLPANDVHAPPAKDAHALPVNNACVHALPADEALIPNCTCPSLPPVTLLSPSPSPSPSPLAARVLSAKHILVHDHLVTDLSTPVWTAALEAWWVLEEATGFQTAVGWWVQRGPNVTRIPLDLDDEGKDEEQEDFYEAVVKWWVEVNPTWRKNEHSASRFEMNRLKQESNGDLHVLFHWLNGLTSVLTCLLW
ncbi:hypothetical protein C8R45DRAFT_1095113 [Mycena sanguinolenta]|nr:hypothetical protein C8R45DRAFT_1095113 [Mycena sanguinolenta]